MAGKATDETRIAAAAASIPLIWDADEDGRLLTYKVTEVVAV